MSGRDKEGWGRERWREGDNYHVAIATYAEVHTLNIKLDYSWSIHP